MTYISILDAATLTGKSMQTIRRMIKSKKVRSKKERTPQGFNYIIEKASLLAGSTTRPTDSPASLGTQTDYSNNLDSQTTTREHRQLDDLAGFKAEVDKFHSTMEKLIGQHEQDKQNFFGLIKTFQDRVIVLENEIKQLQAPKKSWWRLW